VEPSVDGTQKLIVGMRREAGVSREVGEGVIEGDKGVLHQAEAGKPEDSETGDCSGSPVAVEVLLNGLMEDTITTKISKDISYCS
jgi:hypothetical protein